MDYAREIEYADEDFRRRSQSQLDELEHGKREIEAAYQGAIEQVLAEERQAREERELAEAAAETGGAAQAEAAARAERERLEAEAREQRESIARSAASRQAHGYVAPSDDDEWDDPDSQYYRRESWLV
ncbi:hypothetical protein [Nocardia noduli]|uniref:hypothetical protein n=1 Tax=Nocardia noduli TaxID=2815722 RepID=UPI001C24F8C9|nr:hypothetical protein [Nocardia noduli]